MTTTDAAPAVELVPVDFKRLMAVRDALDVLDASDALDQAEELAARLTVLQRELERTDWNLAPGRAAAEGAELYALASALQVFALFVMDQP